MSVTEETLTLLDGMRVGTGTHVDQVTQDLTLAWSRAWNEVATEWESAIADLLAASKDGKWPPAHKVRRARRALRARDATRELLQDLQGMVPIRVMADVDQLLEDVAGWQRRLAASQYPAQAGGTALVTSTFDRVDKDAIRAIVDRTSKAVTSRARPLSVGADAAMRSTLIKGVTIGEHPETVAREMLARVQGAFDGGLHRAKLIARTEILDAHRAASRAQQDRLVSQGVVTGWEWIATLDLRTCPSCLSMHGTQHPPTVAGPLDHQQGRCDRLPVTATWADLGFPDIEEPSSILPDARAWFDGLPRSEQLQIMGAQRLALLDAGKVSWEDLAQRRDTAGWRPSYAPTPVRDLVA